MLRAALSSAWLRSLRLRDRNASERCLIVLNVKRNATNDERFSWQGFIVSGQSLFVVEEMVEFTRRRISFGMDEWKMENAGLDRLSLLRIATQSHCSLLHFFLLKLWDCSARLCISTVAVTWILINPPWRHGRSFYTKASATGNFIFRHFILMFLGSWMMPNVSCQTISCIHLRSLQRNHGHLYS